MKLSTITHVSVDGVMQGLGGPDEDRRGGFERGGWALPLFLALELIDSQVFPKGITVQQFRPNGRPDYTPGP